MRRNQPYNHQNQPYRAEAGRDGRDVATVCAMGHDVLAVLAVWLTGPVFGRHDACASNQTGRQSSSSTITRGAVATCQHVVLARERVAAGTLIREVPTRDWIRLRGIRRAAALLLMPQLSPWNAPAEGPCYCGAMSGLDVARQLKQVVALEPIGELRTRQTERTGGGSDIVAVCHQGFPIRSEFSRG